MQNRYPGQNQDRFQSKLESEVIITPYDQDSKLFEDLQQRNVSPVHVQTVSLASAGSLMIPYSGFHFVCYGHDGSATKITNTTAYIKAFINKRANDGGDPFPAKHARGFSGPFASLYFEWTAQAGVFMDIVILRSPDRPWIDGESCT